MVPPRKKWLPLQHFSEDASCTPNINMFVISLACKHGFRGPVVSGGNVARHLRFLNSRQPKIAYLEIAVLIDQDVSRVQVTMNYTNRMDIF